MHRPTDIVVLDMYSTSKWEVINRMNGTKERKKALGGHFRWLTGYQSIYTRKLEREHWMTRV